MQRRIVTHQALYALEVVMVDSLLQFSRPFIHSPDAGISPILPVVSDWSRTQCSTRNLQHESSSELSRCASDTTATRSPEVARCAERDCTADFRARRSFSGKHAGLHWQGP